MVPMGVQLYGCFTYASARNFSIAFPIGSLSTRSRFSSSTTCRSESTVAANSFSWRIRSASSCSAKPTYDGGTVS
jgi:hypothetical protein